MNKVAVSALEDLVDVAKSNADAPKSTLRQIATLSIVWRGPELTIGWWAKKRQGANELHEGMLF